MLRRAESVEAAFQYLEGLMRLHAVTWNARGQPGAFARPEVLRFVRELIATGVPRGEVDLLEVSAGAEIVGYLMNFVFDGAVSTYQSGFQYRDAVPQLKPGLTCHAMAIEAARAAGHRGYDFLAGENRYKSSLANAERTLYWTELTAGPHPVALRNRVKATLRPLIRRVRVRDG